MYVTKAWVLSLKPISKKFWSQEQFKDSWRPAGSYPEPEIDLNAYVS